MRITHDDSRVIRALKRDSIAKHDKWRLRSTRQITPVKWLMREIQMNGVDGVDWLKALLQGYSRGASSLFYFPIWYYCTDL